MVADSIIPVTTIIGYNRIGATSVKTRITCRMVMRLEPCLSVGKGRSEYDQAGAW